MRRNVLHILGSFNQGGSERQAVQLLALLHAHGNHSIKLASLDGGGVLRGEVERLGYTEFPIFPLTSFYDVNMFRQVWRCARFIRQNKIEIVQAHDFYTNIFGMTAAFLGGAKVRIAAKRETGTRTRLQSFVERRAFSFARAIIVNSDAVKQHLLMSGIADAKIVTIYNGVDLERLSPAMDSRKAILQDLGLPTDDDLQFVVIVANLRSAVKDHRMFLRAARRVKDSFGNARFVVAGEGELLDETKAFASELGVLKETYFLGRCARVADLLSVCDVGVLSSTTEGFSNAILEYMSAGLPVVATNVGGASEAIIENETGFLVESGDDETMASRLIELLVDEEKSARLGHSGRRLVETKFSTDAQLSLTLKLYNELCNEGGQRVPKA